VIALNSVDSGDVGVKLLKLLLEVLQLGVVLVEDLESVLRLASPQPREFSERVQEFLDVVFGALNGTSQEQDHLNNFLVFGDPVVERLTVFFRLVLLVPVLNFFS
jgi:hypothetical protein